MAYILKLLLLFYPIIIQFMYVGSQMNQSHVDQTLPPIDCTFTCSDSVCFRQLFQCLSDSFRRDVSRLTLAMTSQLLQCTEQLVKMNTQLSELVNVTSERLSDMVHVVKHELAAIDKSAIANTHKLDRVKQLLSSRSVSVDSENNVHPTHHETSRSFGPSSIVDGSNYQLGGHHPDHQSPHLRQLVRTSSDHHSLRHHKHFSDVHLRRDYSGQSLDQHVIQHINNSPSVEHLYPVYEIQTLFDPESSHIVKCYLCDGSEKQYLIRTHNRWKRAVAPGSR